MKLRIAARPVLCCLTATFAFSLAASAQRSAATFTPEKILEAIGARSGNTVCEVGAGDGEISISVARLLGPNGRVYSNELGETRVSKLREKVNASGAAQINVVAGESTRTNFPDAGCDAVFLRDVYHHFGNPDSMNKSIAASLKPGGRVAVIDFRPPGKDADAPADRDKDGRHGVHPETVTREMKEAGLDPVSSDLPPQRWFMVVFSRPLT